MHGITKTHYNVKTGVHPSKSNSRSQLTRGYGENPKGKYIPPNRHLIDSKWVFKKKIFGKFRARLVAWGYTQIIEVDFTKNY